MLLHTAIKLHPSLHFTVETTIEKKDFAFIEINMIVDGNKQVKCGMCQKPTSLFFISENLHNCIIREKLQRVSCAGFLGAHLHGSFDPKHC